MQDVFLSMRVDAGEQIPVLIWLRTGVERGPACVQSQLGPSSGLTTYLSLHVTLVKSCDLWCLWNRDNNPFFTVFCKDELRWCTVSGRHRACNSGYYNNYFILVHLVQFKFKCQVFFGFFRFYLFIFREKGREKKRGRETSMCGCLSRTPR